MEISGLEGHWGVSYSVEDCSHCMKVCLVVLLLKRELDSLPEFLRWCLSGWPPLLVTMWVIREDLGNFSPRRKILGGAKIRTSFSVEFRCRVVKFISHKYF